MLILCGNLKNLLIYTQYLNWYSCKTNWYFSNKSNAINCTRKLNAFIVLLHSIDFNLVILTTNLQNLSQKVK